MDKVLLIDGANSIYRACVKFGKVQPNVPDEVIFTFNFFRNLKPIIADFQPVKCFFCLEGNPQFRYDLYPEYKANRRIIKQGADNSRQKSIERFEKTFNIVVPLLKHLPITIIRAARFESDDVIHTLCHDMKDEDITVLSNDSDFIQLLQMGYKNIRIYNPIKKVDMEAPSYPYVVWKAIAGDTSDHIPKILTEKKALKTVSDPELFKQFMSVEENRANFNINRQLIEFRLVPPEELEIVEGQTNFEALKQSFTEMQFESIVNDQSWEKYVRAFDCLKY